MTNIRVHEIAKELNLSSKDIISRLQAMEVDVKNHLSAVEADKVEKLRSQVLGSPSKEQVQKTPEPHTLVSPEDHLTQAKKGSTEIKETKQESPPARPRPQEPRPGIEGQARPQGPRPDGFRPRPPEPRPGTEGQARPAGPRPGMEGQARPQGPRPDGFRPRPPGPRPGMEGQARPAGPRPGMEGQTRPQGPRPDGFRPRPPGPRPGMEGQARPAGPRPGMEGQVRPQGPRPDGFRPRPPGQGPRPGMEGQARPAGPRPGMEGQARPMGPRPDGFRPRPPGQGPRPGMDGQARPAGPRPGMDGRGPRPQGPRPDGQARPFGQRPGMEGSGRPAGSRSTSDSRTPTSTPLEQPKRQAPDKRKPPDKTFDKRKDAEREIRSRGRRPYKSAPKEVRDTTPKYIVIPETINVQDLASKMSRKASELIMKLMGLGVMATINQELDAETATILANDMGVTVEIKAEKSLAVIEEIIDDPKDLKPRPPVVTVMGHVDHGKTSLLDAIRTTNVIDSEAGGITQHIGAYQVEIKGQKITFLDTPGHEAFTSMRARGAQVTDIAVLVVAADDGVMPQTVEAINHAKAAAVPIIVAVNKIDKEDAKPDKVKQELTEHGLVVEEWGGETIAVPVSAKAKTNIEQLLEMILLVAEVKELKANPNRPAMGTVIEAKLDKGKGPVATVLVAKGTLNVGDVILAGTFFGRVRAMVDDKGRRLKKATPSMPVEIQGISEVPAAGELFYVIADEKLARQITSARSAEKRLEDAKQTAKISLEDLFERINQGEVKDLNIIIKADVQGSVEALQQSLLRLSTDEVRVNPIHGGVGAITETDVMLAAASNAIIIGFNVRPGSNTKATAEIQGVDIRLYRVIYDAIEDVKAAMTGLLDPDYKEVVLGSAEVRQVFKVPKIGSVAGCHVVENKIIRSAKVRVIRDGVVIHEGNIDSLRRFKDDVREVTEGYECGIGIERFNDIKEGDKIEAFIIEEVKRQSL